MSSYLERLKAVLAENMPTEGTDKTDKSPSVGFVSDRDAHVSRDEAATISALPQGEPKQCGVAHVDASPAWRRLYELATTPCPPGFPPQRWPVIRDGATTCDVCFRSISSLVSSSQARQGFFRPPST
jgi:hypothetical protein